MKIKKRKTSLLAIFLVLVSTIFTSLGQVFLKTGVDAITNLASVINFFLIFGLLLYGVALLLVLQAYKRGELSVLYPILALGYIWVTFLAYFIFNEPLTSWKLIGVLAIFIGVTLIGIGGE